MQFSVNSFPGLRRKSIFIEMIKVAIEKSLVSNDAQKAAFGIVKASIQKAMKKFEKDIEKEGGSVVVTITGPGTYNIEMDKISLRLRRKIASASKKMFA